MKISINASGPDPDWSPSEEDLARAFRVCLKIKALLGTATRFTEVIKVDFASPWRLGASLILTTVLKIPQTDRKIEVYTVDKTLYTKLLTDAEIARDYFKRICECAGSQLESIATAVTGLKADLKTEVVV